MCRLWVMWRHRLAASPSRKERIIVAIADDWIRGRAAKCQGRGERWREGCLHKRGRGALVYLPYGPHYNEGALWVNTVASLTHETTGHCPVLAFALNAHIPVDLYFYILIVCNGRQSGNLTWFGRNDVSIISAYIRWSGRSIENSSKKRENDVPIYYIFKKCFESENLFWFKRSKGIKLNPLKYLDIPSGSSKGNARFTHRNWIVCKSRQIAPESSCFHITNVSLQVGFFKARVN